MPADEIIILQKKDSPFIILNPEGIIIIKGRWMNWNMVSFSKPINDWVDAYISDPPETTCIDISCEYFSGVSPAILISFLRKFFCVKLRHKELLINWYYEDGDEDILEQGEHISSNLEIPFNFIMTPDYKAQQNIPS
jgi:hypothetical protein